MRLTKKAKGLLFPFGVVIVLAVAYVLVRSYVIPKPLCIHASWFPVEPTAIPPGGNTAPEHLAAVNPEIMARYHPEREVEGDTYVRQAYGPDCKTHVETKQLRLGDAVIGTIGVSPEGFTECVLSGGQLGRPVRARLVAGRCSLTEHATIWLRATVCTPKRGGRLLGDDWWVSEYEQDSSRWRFVIEGAIELPGRGKTVVMDPTEVEQEPSRPRADSLVEDGTLFCGLSPWRPLIDKEAPSPEKLAQVFPDVWRSYTSDPENLPSAPSSGTDLRVSKEHRRILLGEMETAELAWPEEQDGERTPDDEAAARTSERRLSALLSSVGPVDIDLVVDPPQFAFMRDLSGDLRITFVACRDVAGILRAGEQYSVYRKKARIIQVASVTLEADFWITESRDPEGRWKAEKEQFHDFGVVFGPEEQRIHGEVVKRAGGKLLVATLEPEHYRSTQGD